MAVSLPENVMLSRLDHLANWARANSLWPMPFATACCGIELMATGASQARHRPLRRRGHAVFAPPVRPDDRRRPRRDEDAAGPAAHLAADARAEVVHLDGGLRLHRRRLRHLRRRAGRRSLHSRGYLRSRLPAAAGAAAAIAHRPARQRSRRPARSWARSSGPGPSTEGPGQVSHQPANAVVAPGDFKTSTRWRSS